MHRWFHIPIYNVTNKYKILFLLHKTRSGKDSHGEKDTLTETTFPKFSQLFFCEDVSFPNFSNHSGLIIAHLTGFRWARTPALESFCTLPRWSAQVTTGRVLEYMALLQEWLWMLQRFPSWDTSTFHFLTIVVDAHERLLASPLFGSHHFLTTTFGLVLVRAKRLLALRRMTKGQKI